MISRLVIKGFGFLIIVFFISLFATLNIFLGHLMGVVETEFLICDVIVVTVGKCWSLFEGCRKSWFVPEDELKRSKSGTGVGGCIVGK